jgi:hypothetical protein
VLVFGTYDDAHEVLSRWQRHCDQLALVFPFATQLDDLVAVVDSVVTRRPGSDHRHP